MIDRQETAQRISAIVADKLGIDPTTIRSDSTLQDLGADSLDMVEIVIQLEEDFDIQINDEEAASLQTMDDVVNYVHAKQN